MLPTLTASKATLLCTRPISKEATFPSTGLSCKTRRLAGNQPRRKWLLVMEQSRETLSCTFWSREGKCWNVDMKIITGDYVGFDCCVQTCKRVFRSSAPERLVSPPRFARFFIRQVSEFWDHNFSTASDYITAKRDKKASCGHLSEIILIVYDYNYDSNALFGNLLHLCGYQGVEVDNLISILLISTRNNGSFFIFFLQSQEGDTRDATEPFCGSPPCENQPW